VTAFTAKDDLKAYLKRRRGTFNRPAVSMTISCLLRRERSTGAAHRRSALARAQVAERDVMAVAGRPLGSLCELEDPGPKDLKGIARCLPISPSRSRPVRGSRR
jgi:hypothetical protein